MSYEGPVIKIVLIRLSEIVLDAGTQQREKINEDIVEEYAESLRCGARFPSVTVFSDGPDYYLVDGFHRYWAHKKAGIADIQADVREGTKREARLYSAGVNSAHGIRLTNKDKRKAVLMMLNDDEWSQWSDHKIAKHCHVTHPFIGKIRKELSAPQIQSGQKKESEVVTVTTPTNSMVITKEDNTDINQQVNSELPPTEEFDQESSGDEASDTIKYQEDIIADLAEENEKLRTALAINQIPEGLEIEDADTIIDNLQKRVRDLEDELTATQIARDHAYTAANELRAKCRSLESRIKKMVAA